MKKNKKKKKKVSITLHMWNFCFHKVLISTGLISSSTFQKSLYLRQHGMHNIAPTITSKKGINDNK